jgi:hypothetical protein
VSTPAKPGTGAQQEHEFEPVRGLPELLPSGEQMLWQGSPDWRTLARRAFHVRKLVVYFALLAVLRVAVVASGPSTAGGLLVSALWMLLLGATAVGLMTLMAWLSARATVYTVTDKRVVMRIGIVLTLTFNIPFKRIAAAGLHLNANGTGDLPLTLSGSDRIAWLNLWPHARAWHVAQPQPMLRCVPQAADVALLLAQAWSRSTGVALNGQAIGDAQAAGRAPATPSQPAWAGRSTAA